MLAFIKGILISIMIGVPAGPVGVMTIQNTIRSGFRSGLMTGLGSTIADIIFASVGAFGISIISDFIIDNNQIISIIGGILLFFLGIYNLRKPPKSLQTEDTPDLCSKENVIGFTSAFVISITNPATVFAFLFAFSVFDVAENMAFFDAAMLVLGVLAGAILWWLTLTALTAKFKERIKDKTNKLLNIICGGIMIVLAIIILIKAFI